MARMLLIAVALVAAMGFLGDGLKTAFSDIQDTLENPTPAP